MSGTPIMSLWVPAPADNANSREHWAVANKKKRAYWSQLEQRIAVGLIPKPPASPPDELVTALVEWHYPNRRHLLDGDNAIRRTKPVWDFLVKHGYLAGDTAAHLRVLPVEIRVGEPTPPMSSVKITLFTGQP
jgi:hypothetical protein